MEPLTGEVFRMPHETELWDTHVLFYRHRIFPSPSCGSFFDLPSIRFCTGCAEGETYVFWRKEFGKRLHDVRTSRGITQEELAVRLGLASKQHVSRMENGERSCSIDLLIELSCILHVSTDYLLMGSEPSKEEVKMIFLVLFRSCLRLRRKSKKH